MVKLQLCIEFLLVEQDEKCMNFTIIGTRDRTRG